MRLIFALIGGFFLWVFQFRKKRKTFKEIVWGHKYDIDIPNHKDELMYLGIVIVIILGSMISPLFC